MIYLIGIVVLGFLILIHELGHFTMARVCRIPVLSFALGFGPAIVKIKKRDTEYRLNLIPLGGYVQLEGEDGESEDANSFTNQHWSKRLAVLLGGVIFNFASALIMMILLAILCGTPQSKIVITNVLDETSAVQYLKQGDFLVSINDTEINSKTFGQKTHEYTDSLAEVVIQREGKRMSFSIPLSQDKQGKSVIGIKYEPQTVFVKNDSLILNVKDGAVATGDAFMLIWDGLKTFVEGKVPVKDMSGPVGIVKVTGVVAQESTALLVYWVVLLNINLGIMNALPIPALDGGQTVFLFLETVLGKKRWNAKIAGVLNGIFFALLIMFLIFITYQDVLHYIL